TPDFNTKYQRAAPNTPYNTGLTYPCLLVYHSAPVTIAAPIKYGKSTPAP
ncbi:MAG: hypothetical protein Q612_NSC00345G0001, partial [Negativicoccus succinicivorans DORA_17_25]